MNEFLNELARLWWVEVGTELQNPISEKSINGLRKVLEEEYDFDSEVIEYIIESAVKTPTNFHLGGDRTSGMVVGKNDTAVSAHLHTDDNEEEDVVEEEDKDEKDDEQSKERPDSGDDKEKSVKDIRKGSLTAYEKEKLEEIDDKLLKHKLMNPTTNNLNQVSTLLGKKKSDPKAFAVAKSWLGDQGVSDDDIEKQSDKSNDDTKDTSSSGPEGKVSGDPSVGDNQVKNDMLEYGTDEYEKKTGKKPAPGTAGSAFNEIVSGEGIQILGKNPNMGEKDLANEMFKRFGKTGLGNQQKLSTEDISPDDYPPFINENIKKAVGNGTKKNPDNPEALEKAEQEKAVMSKCIISARSARKKFDNSVKRTEKLQKEGKLGENTKTHSFYGADDSLKAQVSMIEESKKKGGKIILPNGTEISHEDAAEFVKIGGGGANPSDTATFVQDDDGNVMVQFHSDKVSTSDIQDNSTLTKEGDNYIDYIDKTNLSDEEKAKSKEVVKTISDEMEKIEENYNQQAIPIAKRLNELPLDKQVDIIEKDKGTMKKNLTTALKAKDGGVKKQYQEYMPEGKTKYDELSVEEQYEIVLKITSDGKGAPNDTKIVNKVASAFAKQNPETEGLDVKKNLAEQRKKVVNLQRQRVNELNKQKVVIDGVEKGLGELMEAEEFQRGFHLDLMDDNNYDSNEPNQSKRFKGIANSSLDVNMGGNVVTGEVLRECTGAGNTKEFKQQFKLREPEGKDSKGRDARFTYDSNNNVTGKKVFVYALDDDGEEKEIGFKTYRSKQGADGKTSNTMQYSKGMKDCFKRKNQ